MKKSVLFWTLFACVFGSCEQNDLDENQPIIVIDSVQVNSVTRTYHDEYRIPDDADVKVFTSLYARKGTLNSFVVRVECDEINESDSHLKNLIINPADVTNNGMTDLEEATLRFKDGVATTRVVIETKVAHDDVDQLELRLYLNGEHAAMKEELVFYVEDEEDEEDD